MSEHSQRFIKHLQVLQQKDLGALAALRHSMAFEPGAYPKAFPYVERFAGDAAHERDARRLALYAVAGLFARHPMPASQSFASAFGELMRRRSKPTEPNASIENRFVALLGADAENIVDYLRHAIALLDAEQIGCDYERLLDDLSSWMNPALDPARRDRLRQRWARDFYRAADTQTSTEPTPAEQGKTDKADPTS